MRGLLRTGLAIGALGCQLADDIDAPRCEKGFHPELQRCVPDETAQTTIRIEAADGGTVCGGDPGAERAPRLDPEQIRVKVAEEFQFDNRDVVPHTIRGATDDQVWVTAAAGARSAFVSIGKVGTWGYRVSGCAKGGTVTVE